jgi:opacity protein-like surface antigen
MMDSRHPRLIAAAVAAMLIAAPTAARADITAFLGAYLTPTRQSVQGVSIGFKILVAGVEFEAVRAPEDVEKGQPEIQEGSASVLVESPTGRVKLYGLMGAGLYRMQFAGVAGDTNTSLHVGGGIKITLAGPIGLRVDYRVVKRNGLVESDTRQRLYVGVRVDF